MSLSDRSHWDAIAEKTTPYHLEKNVALYKKSEHLRLIKLWAPDLKGKRILKTDLYEEAFGNDGFLGWLSSQNAGVYGVDISGSIAQRARGKLREKHPELECYVTSDIRRCAFKDDSFDVIISNSTLDNLSPGDVAPALAELKRVLKPKGTLILTLDNAHNPLYALGYFLEKAWRTNGYYQGRLFSLSAALGLARRSGLIVEAKTAIVHIPTPFNKLALMCGSKGSAARQRVIRRLVVLFSKQGRCRSKFLTGWFIALKLTKNGD